MGPLKFQVPNLRGVSNYFFATCICMSEMTGPQEDMPHLTRMSVKEAREYLLKYGVVSYAIAHRQAMRQSRNLCQVSCLRVNWLSESQMPLLHFYPRRRLQT